MNLVFLSLRPYIEYEQTAAFLTQLFDPAVSEFTNYASLPNSSDASQLQLLEGRLTWLVYIVGAVVRGRLSCSSAEPQDILDGDLALR